MIGSSDMKAQSVFSGLNTKQRPQLSHGSFALMKNINN